jgi:hypothetical protein
MLPLLLIEMDTFFCTFAPYQRQGIKILFHYIGKQVPYAQRYQVTPAVILEIADRLAAAFEKIIRGSRPLSKELARLNLTKVQQGLTEVEQDCLDFFIRHNQCKCVK